MSLCYLLVIEGKYGLLNIHRQNIEGVVGLRSTA